MLRLFYTSKYHNGTYRKCGKGIGVILSLLGASGSVVRMARLVITKVAGGGKDSDGAFALSAQPLRMTRKKGIGVILSLLGASGSVVRMARLVITKVACGGLDSYGAFALSAQPLRMTITAIRTITANTTSGISINGGVRC